MPLGNEPLPPSAANVLRASGIAQLLKTYPNQRFVDTHSHPSLSQVCKLAFRATLLVELNVLITHLRSYILRSSASQFKLSFGKDGSRNLGSPVQLLLLPNRPRP